jgi:2-polyprenyl-3-methyl-5-hydroxy-6-metoxy-1,4-benzoquinol methylase
MATLTRDPEFHAVERIYLGETTGERLIAEHLARYEFASSRISAGSNVLDAACGSGYGTELLSRTAAHVVGLEIADHALAYARQHHGGPTIEYRKADLTKRLELASESFDYVVSLETLEHVSGQRELLDEFHRVLKPGGMLIISTPDHWVMSWLSGFRNQFHLHEPTKTEFLAMLGHRFVAEELFGQTRWRGSRLRAILKTCARRVLPSGVRRIARSMIRTFAPPSNGEEGREDPSQFAPEPVALHARSEHYYQIAIASRS